MTRTTILLLAAALAACAVPGGMPEEPESFEAGLDGPVTPLAGPIAVNAALLPSVRQVCFTQAVTTAAPTERRSVTQRLRACAAVTVEPLGDGWRRFTFSMQEPRQFTGVTFTVEQSPQGISRNASFGGPRVAASGPEALAILRASAERFLAHGGSPLAQLGRVSQDQVIRSTDRLDVGTTSIQPSVITTECSVRGRSTVSGTEVLVLGCNATETVTVRDEGKGVTMDGPIRIQSMAAIDIATGATRRAHVTTRLFGTAVTPARPQGVAVMLTGLGTIRAD